jgi:hypothetical protein
MPHPVHSLLQRFLDTQQHAFDPRERALWPTEQSPQEPRLKANGAEQRASNGHAYKGFEYRI